MSHIVGFDLVGFLPFLMDENQIRFRYGLRRNDSMMQNAKCIRADFHFETW
jgi:hypothetical protein